jgi:hypothetical protein
LKGRKWKRRERRERRGTYKLYKKKYFPNWGVKVYSLPLTHLIYIPSFPSILICGAQCKCFD